MYVIKTAKYKIIAGLPVLNGCGNGAAKTLVNNKEHRPMKS